MEDKNRNRKYSYLRKRRYLSNDDVSMLNEKRQTKRSRTTTSICDTHIDGA